MREFILRHKVGAATVVAALVVAVFSIYSVPITPPRSATALEERCPKTRCIATC